MITLFKRLLILGALLLAPNIAFAQTCIGTPPLTQIVIDNTINICLPTNNANEISALALRQVLQTMTSAIFNLSPVTGFINQSTSLSGTNTQTALNTFTITSDTDQCGFCTDINVTWNYGGATQRGGRINIFGWNIQTTPNVGITQTTVGLGVEGIGQTNSGDGGGSGTEAGTYFGGNFIGACTLFVYECAGAEIDIRTDSAYRGHYTIGLPVVNVEAHQATGLDAAFAIYSGGFEAAAGGGGPWGPGVGFHFGLAFSELGNNGQVPIDSTGTLIGGHVEALSVIPVAYGFDANLFSFSQYFLRCCNLTNKFTVDGLGNTILNTMTATAVAPTVSAAQIGYGSTTAVSSNCGSLMSAVACIVVNIAGTTHYIPYY